MTSCGHEDGNVQEGGVQVHTKGLNEGVDDTVPTQGGDTEDGSGDGDEDDEMGVSFTQFTRDRIAMALFLKFYGSGEELKELPHDPTCAEWIQNCTNMQEILREKGEEKLLVVCDPSDPESMEFLLKTAHEVADMVEHFRNEQLQQQQQEEQEQQQQQPKE